MERVTKHHAISILSSVAYVGESSTLCFRPLAGATAMEAIFYMLKGLRTGMCGGWRKR
jgi:hypothetical protein